MQDPGVAATPGAFQPPDASGLTDAVADATDRFMEAEMRVQRRKDAIGRASIDEEFGTFAQEQVLAAGSDDLTDDSVMKSFGESLTSRMNEVIERHKESGASPDSIAALKARLTGIRANATGRVATMAAEAGLERVNAVLGDRTARLSADAYSNPSSIDGLFLRLEEEIDFVADALNPAQERAARITGRSAIASSALQALLDQGKVDEAEAAMASPGVLESLTPTDRLSVQRTIAETRRGMLDAKNEGLHTRARLRAALGREPTESEMQSALGIDTAPLTLSPGAVAIDPRTGREIARGPAAAPSAAEQKINRLTQNLMADGMTPEEARNKAVAISDGRYAVSRDPVTNQAVVIDKATGEEVGGRELAEVVAEDADESESRLDAMAVAAEEGATLWNSIDGVAGVSGLVTELYSRIGGQIGFGEGPETEETVSNRQFFVAATNDLIRALSINPRFPVGEIERLREEIQISPSMWDSENSLKIRMRVIDRFLANRVKVERDAVGDRSLPAETRQASAQAIKDITAFRQIMGVPQGEGEGDVGEVAGNGPPEGVTPEEWEFMTPEERALFK